MSALFHLQQRGVTVVIHVLSLITLVFHLQQRGGSVCYLCVLNTTHT